jgi:hypothetical protein
MQKNTTEGIRPLAIALVILAGLVRVVQHVNFAPVGALSLFCGARLRGWQAYFVPLALMAVTDPFVGGYSAATPLVYASFMINVWIGTRLRQTESPLWIGSAAVAGSLQFFLLTNFAWLPGLSGLYPHTLAGVINCYAAGIPFYGRTLASDIVYSGVLFGLHSLLSRTVVRTERVAMEATA